MTVAEPPNQWEEKGQEVWEEQTEQPGKNQERPCRVNRGYQESSPLSNAMGRIF